MSRCARNVVVSLSIVAAVGCVALAAQRVRIVGGKTDDSLPGALNEAIPPVSFRAEHVVFDWPVRVAAVESVDGQRHRISVPVPLLAIGTGIVIDRNAQASRVDPGDRIGAGDLIIGGVFENAGQHIARVRFMNGRELTLEPGDAFYIGTKERILRPDQIPCAGGGAAASELRAGDIAPAGETHCWVCECTCDTSDECTIRVASDETSDCGNVNDVECECSNGTSGTTEGCFKKLVPCEPAL